MDQRLNKPFFIDSHCHLPLLKESISSLLEKCGQARVGHILNVGYDRCSSEDSLSLTKFDIILASAGIHPHYATEELQRELGWLLDICKNPAVVAIGEIGLDTVKSSTSRESQIKWFEAQLEIAEESNLPVIIHNRSADDDVERILMKHNRVKGVLHCFSSGIEFGLRMLELGWFLSFSGNITYSKSNVLREMIMRVPASQLLLETDAPYLTPMPYRGKKENSPLMMPLIYQFVSDLRGEDLLELSQKIKTNFESLFLKKSKE